MAPQSTKEVIDDLTFRKRAIRERRRLAEVDSCLFFNDIRDGTRAGS